MPTVNVVQNNFNGGELSPSLIGSFDIEKYQTCFKKGLNAVMTETREIMNRSGLEFVCEVEDSSNPVRLLPFKFNAEQSYIIEAGNKYFRFLQDGGLLKYPSDYGNAVYSGTFSLVGTIGSLVTQESKNFSPKRYDDSILKVGGIWYFAGRFEGDVVFDSTFSVAPHTVVCTIMGENAEVSQVSQDGFHYKLDFAAKQVWQISDVVGNYRAEGSSGETFAYQYRLSDGKIIYSSYVLSAGVMTYLDADFQNPYGIISSISGNNVLIGYDVAKDKLKNQIVKINTPYLGKDLSKLKYAQDADVITFACQKYPPAELARNGYYEWSLANVVTNSSVNSPSGLHGSWNGGSENPRTYRYKVTAVNGVEESPASNACAVVAEYEASWGVGEKIYLAWNSVSGATSYNIYKQVNGVYGFIGSADAPNFIDEKIEPDMTTTPPLPQSPFSPSQNGYPACVTYYQQRRLFANFPKFPQRFILSQVGTSSNFNVSRPTVASDAITVDLSENEINEIKYAVALEDLVILTTGGEWRVKGSDGAMNATPGPVCSPQTYWGCSDIQPIVSGNMILFVTASGDSVRDLGYTYLSDSYDGDNLTTFASHIFENAKIKEWAYIKVPKPYVLAVLDNGYVAMLIYNKKQNVCGWSILATDGEFESVAVSRENGIDIPYFVVQRTINGQAKKYIERMKPRVCDKTENGFFVDSGMTKTFENAVDAVSGLEHLEGREVVTVLDGGVVENLVVENGTVKLPRSAKKITVGLPYTFRLELLPVDTQETVGKLKKITAVSLKIRNSREDFFVQTGAYKKQLPRSVESIKNSNWLKTGSINTQLFSEGKTETELVIEQSLPLPLCISAITQTVTVG